ncbi:MAG: TetR/AcrR family transcriptional regulator [Solirubrobacteraceae bacterium]
MAIRRVPDRIFQRLCVQGHVGVYSVKSTSTMPPRSTPSRSRRRQRHPLSRELILVRAVALIEEEGPHALSMRRLGSALGVEAMAIYHHFEGREELLRAIGDRLLEPLHDLELGADWRAACRRFATALRDLAVGHPATFQLLGLQPFDSASALRSVERLLTVLVDRGFSPGYALAIYRATVSYARGYALAEATGFTVDAELPAGRGRLAGLPAGEFPVLAGRAPELGELDADAAYELGLNALLSGLPDPCAGRDARRVQPRSAEGRP